jgi:predicted PurR-regulated permease PerM
MRTQLDQLVPPRFRPTSNLLLYQINIVLSTYVRSQLLIALAMGVLYAAGFFLLQVPLAVTLGFLTGLLNFVPYLGTLTGLGLSLAFLALNGAGLPQLLALLLVFVLVQSIEGYYLTPKLLGSHLDLHPLLVLVGLMIGGNLFGLLGVILAIPLLATALVLLRFLLASYRQSSFYLPPLSID